MPDWECHEAAVDLWEWEVGGDDGKFHIMQDIEKQELVETKA